MNKEKRSIGFSTGALALGDFRSALHLLASHDLRTIELSALREHELPELMFSLDELNLDRFDHISIHAPNRISAMKEKVVVNLLQPCIERKWPIIIHPDVIVDQERWRDFDELLCIENLDKRKLGRTVRELVPIFEALPKASFCLDLAHARQVDPTFGVARELLREFGDRLTQIHISELNCQSRHEPLSMATVWAVQEISHLIPSVPVIIESMVKEDGIEKEIDMVKKCFSKR